MSANGERVAVLVKTAGERYETTGALGDGTWLGAPGRRAARGSRRNPNLENTCWRLLKIVFGMPDSSPGAHDLDVSRFDLTFVTETISVREYALTNIRDDLDIGVRV